jgi:hypothetical protein
MIRSTGGTERMKPVPTAMYIRDAETRATMLGIADQFERLGRLAEQRANGSDLRRKAGAGAT